MDKKIKLSANQCETWRDKLIIFAEFLFFLVAFNPDLKHLNYIWFPVVFLLVGSILLNKNQTRATAYLKWRFLYLMLLWISLIWSISLISAFSITISLLLISISLMMIYINISNEDDIFKIINIMILALLVDGVYVVNEVGLMNYIGVPNLVYWAANSTSLRYALGLILILVVYNKHYSRWGKIFLFVSAVVFLYVLIFSGSRGALLLLAVSFVSGIFIKKDRIAKKLFLFISILIVFSIFIYLIMNNEMLYQAIGRRFTKFFEAFEKGGLENAEGNRIFYIRLGIEKFLEKPFWGYGSNSFILLNPQGVYSHNDYIDLLVEFGALGVFIYYGAYVYLIKNLTTISEHKIYHMEYFAGIIFGLLVFNMVAITRNDICVQTIFMLMFAFIEFKNKKEISQTTQTNIKMR